MLLGTLQCCQEVLPCRVQTDGSSSVEMFSRLSCISVYGLPAGCCLVGVLMGKTSR